MRPEEIRALGDLAAEAGTGIADQARDLHAAVAARMFGALGAAGLPVASVRLVHDSIARGSYRAGRGLTSAAVRGGTRIGADVWRLRRSGRAGPGASRSLAATPRGRVALGVLGGVAGARLRELDSPLATEFTLVVDDRRPRCDSLAVFVHGLGETELSWRPRASGAAAYGDRLAAECGVTPVYARYNSGLSIAENGTALAAALAALDASWPAEIRELTLIGHSMGGLLIREACHRDHMARWCGLVRRTICLGSPHEGAPLAGFAGSAERALSWLPETRPLAAPLRARSPAIRDLATGVRSPLHPGAAHYFVSASVTRDPDGLGARVLGDLLVLRHSAWAQNARGERLRVEDSHYRHLSGVNHFDLLAHSAVGELLIGWVSGSCSGTPRAVKTLARTARDGRVRVQRP